MFEVLILVLKVILIAAFALYFGKKTGLFSLGKGASLAILAVLAVLFSAEIYAAFFRDDISLVIMFESSFFDFTLDLSFFLRILLFTLLLGLICSVFGVRLSSKISSAKDLCALGLLIAITVLLAVYATLRIGGAIKIPFKFISVFITAAIFGPFWGGMIGAIADVIAFMISPVGGAFVPQITMVEFLYGFTYGLVFFNMSSWGGYKTMLKIIFCVIFQIVFLNLGLTTYLLAPMMNMSFETLLATRAYAGVINMALQLIVISVISKYISSFRKILK
ncbi:MAG: folate family ECF transporter S component [Ruminococcaceae bacterium]|nr:folate family ECF transporter S component [Oscillospiraceae bacterium]